MRDHVCLRGLKYLDIILKPPKEGENWRGGDRDGGAASAEGSKGNLFSQLFCKNNHQYPEDPGAALCALSGKPLPDSHHV